MSARLYNSHGKACIPLLFKAPLPVPMHQYAEQPSEGSILPCGAAYGSIDRRQHKYIEASLSTAALALGWKVSSFSADNIHTHRKSAHDLLLAVALHKINLHDIPWVCLGRSGNL
jgi:hypothetical protein